MYATGRGLPDFFRSGSEREALHVQWHHMSVWATEIKCV